MFQPKAGYNPKDAWFRSPYWDREAQADFETHLARSRPFNRRQYRKLKGFALLQSDEPGAEAAGYRMLRELLADPDTGEIERVSVLSQIGAHEHDRGLLDDAERDLRQAIATMRPSRSGSNGLEAVRLAEILLEAGGTTRLEEARRLLEVEARRPSIFLSVRFRLCVASARVLLALGDPRSATVWAATALDLAAREHSGLAKHPTLGLVELDPALRDWLQALAVASGPRDIQ
ncbi:MAG TPA: hypothetical protein VF494_05275 [Candidatus Limnocylindrales bacterium]